MVDVGTGLALLSVSAPVTVAIIKLVGRPRQNGYIRKDVFEQVEKRWTAWMESISLDLEQLKTAVGKQGRAIAGLSPRKPSDTTL